MTIAAETADTSSTASGSVATFVVGWTYAAASEVVVTVKPSGGSEVIQVNGVDYDLTGDGLAGSGAVVFRAGHLPPAAATVRRYRTTPVEQPDTFGSLAGFDPLNVERSFDRLVRILQEMKRDLATGGVGGGGSVGPVAWSSLVGVPAALTLFGALSATANTIPYFDSGASMAKAPITSFSRSLLALNDAAAWKTALGVTTGGSSSVDWADVTGKPSFGALSLLNTVNNNEWSGTDLSVANGGTGASSASAARSNLGLVIGSDVQAYSDVLQAIAGLSPTTGKIIEFTGATTARLITTPSGSGGGDFNMPNFVTSFAGVGDGSTNNDTAFTNADASAYEYIWLPEGTYVTTKTRQTLTKTYLGPGRIKMTTNRWVQNFGSYNTNVAFTGNTEYGQDGAVNKFSHGEYRIIQAGLRIGANEKYFHAPAVPHFAEFRNDGGHSGISGLTSASMTTSSTSVAIAGGVTGWNVGETVHFVSPTTGLITDTKVLTLASGGNIGWSGGLSQSYASGTVITHGMRTMQTKDLAILDHRGLGDAYLWCGRVIVSQNPVLASQDKFQYRATGGLIGGDSVVLTDGCYVTGWEFQFSDGGDSGHVGNDVCIGGFVNSYVRTNNTGARDCFWIHDYCKMDNLAHIKPVDGIWCAAMKANVGLDLSRSTFTTTGSFNNCAIALSAGQKIFFNTSISYPGTGNGFTANVMGDTWASRESDGTSPYFALWCGSYRVAIRNNGVMEFNGQISASGAVTASTNVSASSYLQAGTYVSAGSYITASSYVNGSEIRVNGTKVVGARAGTIPDTTLDLGVCCSTLNSLLGVLRTHGLHT